MLKKIFLVPILILVFIVAKGQASWEQFGQNRIQYRTFEWKYFDSTHFRTFYYDYGKANAVYALNLAEQELSHIVYMMGGRLNKKLNLIIYNSFGDYRQETLDSMQQMSTYFNELDDIDANYVSLSTCDLEYGFNSNHRFVLTGLMVKTSGDIVLKD